MLRPLLAGIAWPRRLNRKNWTAVNVFVARDRGVADQGTIGRLKGSSVSGFCPGTDSRRHMARLGPSS